MVQLETVEPGRKARMDERNGTTANTSMKKFFPLGAVALGILASPVISYLWTNHKSHSMEILLFLALILCPVLHFFHHKKRTKNH